ncbi:MAG: hypothetical protein AMXMBFR56_72480 [Polyangiaceae bacterium]
MSSYLQAAGPVDASATVRGLMNNTAQILAGLKTFQTTGNAPTDVTMRIGTTSAAPTAYGQGGYRALSILTSIGGSEVEWVNVRPENGGADYSGIINIKSPATNKPAIDVTAPGGGAGWSGGISWATWNGGSYVGPYTGQSLAMYTTNRGIWLAAGADAYLPAGTAHLKFSSGGIYQDTTRARFSFESDALASGTVRHSRWMIDGVEVLGLVSGGTLVGDGGVRSSAASSVLTLNESMMKGARGAPSWSLNEAGGGTAQIYNTGAGLEVHVNTPHLWGRGSGASDVAVRVGASTADGSVSATAKLLSVGTGYGGGYTEKLHVIKDGTIELTGSGVGIVLASPNGTRYRLTVTNAGALNIAAA